MSTLSPAEAGPPFPCQNSVTAQDTQLARHVAFVPRSAFDDAIQPNQASKTSDLGSLFDLRECQNYDLEVPSHGQSTLSMGSPESGAAPELVAHFDSYTNGSATAEILQSQHTYAPGLTASNFPEKGVRNLQEPPGEHIRTAGYSEEKRHSPRKPIPAQWFSKCNGPNLATAQRAKERSQKKGSQNGSPVEAKILRGTRSSFDIGQKTTTPEGASFLTKEALAAVENDITTPTSPCSQSKLKKTPSKSTRNSPNVSPMRSSPRQSAFTNKISPTRTTFLSTTSALTTISGIPHSTATSVSGNSFYTAEGSPVRSCVDSEISFQSATESFEDDVNFPHDFNADSEKVQAVQNPNEIWSPLPIVTAGAKKSPAKPKLTLTIPHATSANQNDSSPLTLTSRSNGSATSVRARNMNVASQSSRIPRAATASRSESARGPTRSSISKRVQPTESFISKENMEIYGNQISTRSHHSELNAALASTHILTIDSSIETEPHRFEEPSANLENDSGKDGISVQTLVTTSTTVSTPPQSLRDPVLVDSAIIYSRKKTIEICSLDSSKAFNVGNSIISDDPAAVPQNQLPLQQKDECNISINQSERESKQPNNSASGSDLRATAADFVPQAIPAKFSTRFTEDMAIPNQPCLQSSVVDSFGLDQYDIPWFYYLYPIQFAYEQGFRNGRSRSPKKFRQKKQRSSNSSPIDAHNSLQCARVATIVPKRENAAPYAPLQHESPTVLMTHPLIPADHIQAVEKQPGSQPDFVAEQEAGNAVSADKHDTPFSSQYEMIKQQATLTNGTNYHTPRFSNVDLTTVRNVAPSYVTHKSHRPNYYAFSRRGQRQGFRSFDNGLYGGRSPTGVPIYATMPFPDPVPPPSRLDLGITPEGCLNQYLGYSIGAEACGIVEIETAAERAGNEACNACAPDH